MYRSIEVEIEVEDIVEKLDADDLKQLGLIKMAAAGGAITAQIHLAAVRGDLPAFIEHTRQLLDEKMDVFIRTDRLLANLREVATP